MFSWLFGRRARTVARDEDQIWRDTPARLAGIAAAVAGADPQRSRTLVLAHFRATIELVEGALRARGLACRTLYGSSEATWLLDPSTYAPPGAVLLSLAELLPHYEPPPDRAPPPRDFTITLLVAEHHPLRSGDAAIERWAPGLPAPARLVFHDSLDSPLIRHFGGERVLGLLDRMQVDDSVPISGRLLGRSIAAAQDRIAKNVTSPLPANSAEQWFQLNT